MSNARRPWDPDWVPTRTYSIYKMFDLNGALLYVGMTLTPLPRLNAHHNRQSWWDEVARIEIVPTGMDRETAQHFEAFIIKKNQPRYNVVHNGKR
jgi:excinuclease UvrABC nuclease subunit